MKRALFLAGLLLLGGVAYFGFARRASPAKPAARPNVLLVTLDTLRGDAVHPGHGTPALDAFLSRATWFTNARTEVPLTEPAHTTILSGLDPCHHGVHDNGPALPADRTYTFLSEQARRAGYQTAGFVSSKVIDTERGFSAGFQTFDSASPAGPWRYVEAPKRVEPVLAWLKQVKGKGPFFCWVHFYDCHWPYRPFAGDARRPATTATDSDRVRYAGELRRIDESLEKLFAAIPKNTCVVIASDHGEGFGDHGEPTHGGLCYSSTVHVFLAARGPGLAAGARDGSLRGLSDIAPTVREWCGWPAQPTDGKPLTGPGRKIVISEALYAWRVHGWGQCFAAADGRFTLVESGPAVELFDTRADPDELHPLSLRGNEAYERLDRAMAAYRTQREDPGVERRPPVSTPYASAVRPERGYLTRAQNAALPDPRLHLKDWAELERLDNYAEEAFNSRNGRLVLQVLGKLETLWDREKNDPAVAYCMAHVNLRLGQLDDNTAYYKDAARWAGDAFRLGYRTAHVANQALEYAVACRDREEISKTLALVLSAKLEPDIPCAESVTHAARMLAVLGDRKALQQGRTFLDRAALYLKSASEKKRLSQLRGLLQ